MTQNNYIHLSAKGESPPERIIRAGDSGITIPPATVTHQSL
ncbi:MAG TPA: hypothetical protein VJC37_02100 [Planctomycetota bacterium]|nr:hypothetical protein [Planctomycetota bacterium]